MATIHPLFDSLTEPDESSSAAATPGGARAARLRAIKADIAVRLDRGGLTVGALAARHGVTPRYVQMLFQDEGTTFTAYVRHQLLAQAHRMLTDPRLAARSITSVAFDSGFRDLSYFNRTFRRRFGCSPSQARQAARHMHQAEIAPAFSRRNDDWSSAPQPYAA